MLELQFQIMRFFTLVVSSIIFWCLAFSFFIMIRYFAYSHETVEGLKESSNVPITQWLDLGIWLGIILGFFYGSVEYIFERFLAKKQSLILVLIEKAFIYLIVLIFCTTFISFLVENRVDKDIPNESFWWVDSNTFWLVVGYFIIMSQVFAFYKMANRKFGYGVLWNLITGYYRNPKEEKKVFMFLDLQSSTSIDE